jgi:hypothetical protein
VVCWEGNNEEETERDISRFTYLTEIYHMLNR